MDGGPQRKINANIMYKFTHAHMQTQAHVRVHVQYDPSWQSMTQILYELLLLGFCIPVFSRFFLALMTLSDLYIVHKQSQNHKEMFSPSS